VDRVYVKVIDEKCCGYALCADACPDVYKLDDQGFVYVEDTVVPAGLEEAAKKGAAVCPEEAILVSDAPFER
jgi:ferredoxin